VKVAAGVTEKKSESTKIPQSWNAEVSVLAADSTKDVVLSLYKKQFPADKLLGKATVSLSGLTSAPEFQVYDRYTLTDTSGKVRYCLLLLWWCMREGDSHS